MVLKLTVQKQSSKQSLPQALLVMSVLQQKIEFYKRESDCEAIIIAAGGLGAL